MRALLIVNPHATSTTEGRRDVITHALASAVALEVVQTRYRGHAARVAEGAARTGYGLVLTLGGDGTVNEVVNGLLRACPPTGAGRIPAVPATPAAQAGPAPHATPAPHAAPAPPAAQAAQAPEAAPATPALATLPGGSAPDPGAAPMLATPPGGIAPDPPAAPMLATLPGGSANVLTRALGLPADPVDATGRILAALAAGRSRTIGLGLAGRRYFCCNAGLGLDAEVVRVVEGLRARGRAASAGLYVWATARQFATVTNRREPALTLERDGAPAIGGLFLGTVSNTSPWTYLGQRPVVAAPGAGFDAGLDVFALASLGALHTVNVVRRMLASGGPSGKHVVALHNQPALAFRANRPVAFQVDGEYVGETEHVMFRSIPNALRVLV